MQHTTNVTDPTRDPAAIARAKAQVAELKQMFADTALARAQRQRDKPLYERLGGRDAIHAVVADIVELHCADPITAPLMRGVDNAKLTDHVVAWLCKMAGGPEVYAGRDMRTAHAHLGMNDVHFMTAGDHIMRVLGKYGVPAPEAQEVLCAIIAHHDDVIT